VGSHARLGSCIYWVYHAASTHLQNCMQAGDRWGPGGTLLSLLPTVHHRQPRAPPATLLLLQTRNTAQAQTPLSPVELYRAVVPLQATAAAPSSGLHAGRCSSEAARERLGNEGAQFESISTWDVCGVDRGEVVEDIQGKG
jgi:hypothetical protein